LLLILAACGEPTLSERDGSIIGPILDGGMEAPPDAPMIERLPERLPWPVATIRGTSDARRILLEGPGNPVVGMVLPGGAFCIDAAIPEPGPYVFRLYAQGDDGQLSERPAIVNVEYDPQAPSVPGAETCSGDDPAGCAEAEEICGDNRDNDCNNLIDDRDPACADCTDDAFEPNNDPNAPRIEPGLHQNLVICPGDPDFYGILTEVQDRLTVTASFSHAEGNLDLELRAPDRRTVVARSTSTSDDEMLSYTATAAGEVKLLVFGPEGAENFYNLRIEISPGT